MRLLYPFLLLPSPSPHRSGDVIFVFLFAPARSTLGLTHDEAITRGPNLNTDSYFLSY